MSVICHIDNSEWDTLEEMHDFLKRRMKRSDYYEKYYPKFCLGTGEKILFKDYDQYFSQKFKDKAALEKWLQDHAVEGREWAHDWLKARKEEKSLVYAPSQAELKSLMCPNRSYYDSIGSYYTTCKELGFKDRYTVKTPTFTPLPKNVKIICDTREQLPLKLPPMLPLMSTKLDYGDYALADPHNKGIYIERKGLGDFVGTLNCRKVTRKKGDDSSFERFDRELERAATNGHYVVMLVEASIENALSFDELPEMKWSKVSPGHVFKNLRDLLVKYPLNFQAVFADGRSAAARTAIRIFEMGEQVKRTDLQYALERGVL